MVTRDVVTTCDGCYTQPRENSDRGCTWLRDQMHLPQKREIKQFEFKKEFKLWSKKNIYELLAAHILSWMYEITIYNM